MHLGTSVNVAANGRSAVDFELLVRDLVNLVFVNEGQSHESSLVLSSGALKEGKFEASRTSDGNNSNY